MRLRSGSVSPVKESISVVSRLRIALLLLLSLLLTGVFQTEAQPLEVNLRGLSGAALRTSEVASGNTVLVVWASWSPRCRDIVDRLNGLNQRWSGKARVYGVSFNEDAAEVERFLAGKSLGVPTLLDADGSFSKKQAITVLPGLVVVQGGQVTYAGKLPDSPDSLLSGLLK
jgi:thiol-disulfide isomerase/thioredoxin